MRGTSVAVNTALSRSLLYLGVERDFVMINALLCFPLVAATSMHVPACFFGVALFVLNHVLLVQLSKYDPIFAKVMKRYSRYCWQSVFPARSHPSQTSVWTVNTVVMP